MSLDQNRAPLYEALIAHASKRQLSFHVPGHRWTSAYSEGAEELSPWSSLWPLDVTELEGLDNLHHPEGVILEAEQLCAEAFGAARSFFLVGGSTAGNLAMVLASCPPGGKILASRWAHQSFFHACYLAQAQVALLPPLWDEGTGSAYGIQLESVQAALESHPDVKAIFVTNPNYYGIGMDLRPLARLAQHYGVLLLVDEAHGAHYAFHPQLPPPALSCGADVVVQSLHKTLPALTMGAVLHLKKKSALEERLRQALQVVQTSSPSYPIMASMDVARKWMVRRGRQRIENLLFALRHFRHKISEAGWHLPAVTGAGAWADPLRLVLRPPYGSGYQWLQRMASYGIWMEMADPHFVVGVLTPANQPADLEGLLQFCTGVHSSGGQSSTPAIPGSKVFHQWDGRFHRFQQWVHIPLSWVPMEEGEGQVAARMVVPYPPGVPLLLPGEKVEEEHLHILQLMLRQGATVHGLKREGQRVWLPVIQ